MISAALSQSSDKATAWVAHADAQRAGTPRVSGYVTLEDGHYHVAQTPDGPLVSKLRWRRADGGEAVARHDPFSVTAEDCERVLEAWSRKLAAEAALRAASAEDVLRGGLRGMRSR